MFLIDEPAKSVSNAHVDFHQQKLPAYLFFRRF
jgi:hypothetical protein